MWVIATVILLKTPLIILMNLLLQACRAEQGLGLEFSALGQIRGFIGFSSWVYIKV